MHTVTRKPCRHNPNRSLSTLEVLARLKVDLPDVHALAEVVGAWVWVSFDAKPSAHVRDTLKALGFRWNRRRECWQHPCGRFSTSSPGNPRFKYGTVPASAFADDETVEKAQVA